MAAELFLDLDSIDLSRTLYDHDAIYRILPQRHEFEQLDRIVHVDKESGLAIAVREVREDEFWVRGHIPGRPLLPGVLMLETAAQMSAFLYQLISPDERFTGFGGVDEVKFRGAVVPPATMYFILKVLELRRRRVISEAQGIVDGKLVFEGRITGLPL